MPLNRPPNVVVQESGIAPPRLALELWISVLKERPLDISHFSILSQLALI